jgi:hypothetical protein
MSYLTKLWFAAPTGGVWKRKSNTDVTPNYTPDGGYTPPTVGGSNISYTAIRVGSEALQSTAARLSSTQSLILPTAPSGTPIALGDFSYGTVDAFRTFSSGTPRFVGFFGQGQTQTYIAQTAGANTKNQATIEPSGVNVAFQMNFNHFDGGRIAGFTVLGTDQSANGYGYYNGLSINNVSSPVELDHVNVFGNGPGYASAPPGETFLIHSQAADGLYIHDVLADGRRNGASGTSVSASNIGLNSSNDLRLKNVESRYSLYGTTLAMYQVKNVNFVDVKTSNSHSPQFNLERVSGTVNVVRPSPDTSNVFMAIANDCGTGNYDTYNGTGNPGYATVNIYDPVIPAGQTQLTVRIYSSYAGHAPGAAFTRAGGSGSGGSATFSDPYHDVKCWTGGTWDDVTGTYTGGTLNNALINITG